MNWDRVNTWTITLYAIIHSLRLAKAIDFGNLTTLHASILNAATWLPRECSYPSALLTADFGNATVRFRRDPVANFQEIVERVICMLIQDLVVILDGMMDEARATCGEGQ